MRAPADRGLSALVRLALAEDIGRAGDLSTGWFLAPRTRLKGAIVAKQAGVVCGIDAARAVFRHVSPRIRFTPRARDGARVRPRQVIAEISGPREVLTAERTALNFLQRLSGVASLTRAYADRLKGTRARLLDT